MRNEKRSVRSAAMKNDASSKKKNVSETIAKRISSRAKLKTTKRANGSSAIQRADSREILTTKDRKKTRLVRRAGERQHAKSASESLKKRGKPEYRSKKKMRNQRATLAKLQVI